MMSQPGYTLFHYKDVITDMSALTITPRVAHGLASGVRLSCLACKHTELIGMVFLDRHLKI